ncbi:AraC family transcriptional regulator [Mucilaginibacter sp. SP1R1]|uniref:AraC family transcriptional regulator n=1 Tax=Mucilaginibacter sp. SP1R1 TaxID=2723091 RepID=UPI00161856EE|nr:AraC family transcriptional regulator [Mucilaginibacter sp. SP1R1]MBB6150599.1 AraC-like DNA-binding protein [Mucilaginibacter sp. SP1R1]
MKKRQFEPLAIRSFEESVFHLPQHSHTYYEIIYIHKGSGIHILNKNQLSYKAGDLFLISPEDEHNFDIKKQTHFTLIKFTDQFFNSGSQLTSQLPLIPNPEDMMRNKLLKEVKIVFDEPSSLILKNTVENIVAVNPAEVATSPFMFYQILSIFGLIKQAINKLDANLGNCHYPPRKEELISYLHQHIYEPEKILIKNVAAYFNIAPNYFSSWFKRNFDISYRDYVNAYRTKLIELRVGTDRLTLRQIADEFGFTDVSHLSNYFKKKTNTTASSYRKLI